MKKVLILYKKDTDEISDIIEKLNKDFSVLTATSIVEAIDCFNQNDIFMFFCELTIVSNDGTSFLEIIKNKYPNIIRIILGGEEEDPKILEAIQRNIARTCLLKPWQNNILKLAKKLSVTEEKLKELNISLKDIDPNDIPTIKDSYRHILDMIDYDGNMDKIATAISEDPVITVNILRIANSAYYGVKTASVKQAVVYLGFKNIRELVLASAVYDAFSESNLPETIVQPFWQQAFQSSRLVAELYRLCGKRPQTHAQTSGLLMNIGIIFLLNLYGKRYFKIIQEARRQDKKSIPSLEQLEMEELGITHSQAGGYLLNWWGIPYTIVEGVLYHHTPLNENVIDRDILCILHLVEYFTSRQLEIENKDTDIKECCSLLGIKLDYVEKIAEIFI